MGVLKARVGTTWEPVMGAQNTSPGNAIGVIAIGAIGGGTYPGSGVLNITSTPVNVYCATGRRYRIFAMCRATTYQGTGHVQAFFYDNGANSSIVDQWGSGPAGANGLLLVTALFDGNDAQHSFDLRINGGANGTVFYGGAGSQIYVEDVGPNSSPPLTLPVTAPAWTPMTLVNNWVNYGSGYPVAAYRKIGDEVQLRGLIKSGTFNAHCATLPTGFRVPYAGQHYICNSNNSIASVRPYVDGTIFMGTGDATWVDLAVVRYSVTP